MTPSCTLHTVHSGPPPAPPLVPPLSWLITGRPQHVANLVAWQRPPHCFNGHFNAPPPPHPISLSLSCSPSSCCRCYCCHSPSALHAVSHMCEVACFFFEKLFHCCLLRPTLLLISPTVPQPQPQPQHAPMPVALPCPLPACPLVRAAGFCPRLGFYPQRTWPENGARELTCWISPLLPLSLPQLLPLPPPVACTESRRPPRRLMAIIIASSASSACVCLSLCECPHSLKEAEAAAGSGPNRGEKRSILLKRFAL